MSEPMSEMDPREAEIDNLLRRSMAAPVPRLPSDFNQVLSREVRRRSGRPNRYGQILLAGYGVMSAAASVVVMRGQGLGWGAIAVMTLGPLAMVEAARRFRRKQWEGAAK
jgi:anti-sigma factor RsiW